MTSARAAGDPAGAGTTFRHDLLLYDGPEGFVAGAVPFLLEGVRAGEPAMVAVRPERIARLRQALGGDADRVRFADMAKIGRNPGRIISAWRDFLDAEHAWGRPARGIGEPVWPEREPAELAECRLHESLLNLAFADAPRFTLRCPYDASALDDRVLHAARSSHPHLLNGEGARRPCPGYRTDPDLLSASHAPLAPPRGRVEALAFDRGGLREVRELVARRAGHAALPADRARDLVLAVHEIASNSIRHGGGQGVLRVWHQPDGLVCEVRDRGRIRDPLVGRARPAPDCESGRGVWMAHELADLVQLRSDRDGTVVRLVMRP